MEINKTWNPLSLSRDIQFIEANECFSPNQIIEQYQLNFNRPFYLLVNGEPVLRADWDKPVPNNSILHFVELPQGGQGGNSNPVAIIAMLAVVAIAAYTGGVVAGYIGGNLGTVVGGIVQGVIVVGGVFLVNQFLGLSNVGNVDQTTTENAATAYSLTSGRNMIALGQPFPEHFGRFKFYPNLIQNPFGVYVDHEQFYYMLGVVGVGEYDIEGVYIDKTPFSEYADSSYNILAPGVAPTLCPEISYVCSELNGQELGTDWINAVVSAPGTVTYWFGVDILFSSGLVGYNDRGEPYTASVEVIIKQRLVDDDGNPTTDWVESSRKIYSAATRDPRRYSERITGVHGPGRYELAIKRTTAESSDSKMIDKAAIGGVRGVGALHPDYGDVTLFECKIKATKQLSGGAASKVNVIATRKLKPVESTGMGASLAATRSIVDACAYIVTSYNGGKQVESILDFSSLHTLRTTLEGRSNYFDYRFTSRISVMEACSKVARCGRSVPIMPGGLFSLVRDELQTLPVQVYTDDDYTAGSFEMNHILRTEDSPTCVEVKYIDPDTWENESVYCYELGGNTENPAVLQLEGCTNRQHAWEEGMYMYKDDEINRTAVQFVTGLKGHIPRIGRMIFAAAPSIDWGQSGLIEDMDDTGIWLSEPVDFGSEASEGVLYVVTAGGAVAGPYTVTPTDYAHCVSGSIPASVNTVKNNGTKASKYIFGLATTDLLRIRVTKITPQSQNEIRVEGSIIHDEVHTADQGTAPPLSASYVDYGLCEYADVGYQGVSGANRVYRLSWMGSATKFKAEIDTGSGFVLHQDNLSAYSVTYETTSMRIRVRVTPYDGETLMTAQVKTSDWLELPATPTNLRYSTSATEKGILIQWNAVSGVDRYEAAVWNDGAMKIIEVVESNSHRVYFADVQYVLGGLTLPWEDAVTVKVRALKDGYYSDWTELEIDVSTPRRVGAITVTDNVAPDVTIEFGINDPDCVDGFVFISGPDQENPTDGSEWVFVQEDTTGTCSSVATGTVLYADLWEGANNQGTGFPYTVAVAAYYDNLKALDFLLWRGTAIFDPS